MCSSGRLHAIGSYWSCCRWQGDGAQAGLPTQSEDANPLQKRLSGAVENYQVIGGDELGPGRLENIVNLLPGLTVRIHIDGTLRSHKKHIILHCGQLLCVGLSAGCASAAMCEPFTCMWALHARSYVSMVWQLSSCPKVCASCRVQIRAAAACEASSATRTQVAIDDARLELGPFRCGFQHRPPCIWPTSLHCMYGSMPYGSG